MSRYIDADKYMNHLRANINATSDTINKYIKEDDPIGTVKDGGQIGYLWALQWARRSLECDCYTVKAVSLDRIKSLRDDAIKYRDDKANDFVDFEVGAINGVIALIDELIAEAEGTNEAN